jgi:putative hydrolase of the HAD superfamily
MAQAGARIRAVLWDFGGVLTTSPFDAFAAYELSEGLPAGFIRRLNATNPDTNAWAQLERGHLQVDEFADRFEEEAAAAGSRLDARAVLSRLGGELRPAMVEALRRCHERLKTALLTNNFAAGNFAAGNFASGNFVAGDGSPGYGPVLDHFDVVLESSRAGCRKPDPEFYWTACRLLAIDPSEAVFLDDLGVNLKPARQMGMHTVKVSDPEAALDELEGIVGFALSG